jgi:hypothetical protein
MNGEGNIGGGRTLADSRSRFRRGNDGSTQRRVALELVKPSWSRGETPRSKVGAGNGVEGQRVAAGSVGVKNRRQCGGTLACKRSGDLGERALGVQGDPAGRGTANDGRHGGDDKDLYRCAGTEDADR